MNTGRNIILHVVVYAAVCCSEFRCSLEPHLCSQSFFEILFCKVRISHDVRQLLRVALVNNVLRFRALLLMTSQTCRLLIPTSGDKFRVRLRKINYFCRFLRNETSLLLFYTWLCSHYFDSRCVGT